MCCCLDSFGSPLALFNCVILLFLVSIVFFCDEADLLADGGRKKEGELLLLACVCDLGSRHIHRQVIPVTETHLRRIRYNG